MLMITIGCGMLHQSCSVMFSGLLNAQVSTSRLDEKILWCRHWKWLVALEADLAAVSLKNIYHYLL